MTAVQTLSHDHPAVRSSRVIVIDLYCRMSKGDDGTIFKCEDQERQGRESVANWARQQGLVFGEDVVIGKVLYDHALSAWKAKVVRPSFNEIMDRLESGQSHGVWVRDVDRFVRKMHEAVRIADVAKAGARVLALRSDYDLTTRKGRKRFLEDAMDAEDESSRISERVRDGLKNKALRGRSLASSRGFARPGYLPNPEGWEPGDPRVWCPEEQVALEVANLRDAVERILAGEAAMNTIADEWNEAGLTTTKGGRWDAGILRQMMEKPALAGLVVHGGKIVGELADGSEPPLDRETWDRLQAFFAGRKRGRTATEYLLSGIVRCRECGNLLYGRPLKARPRYADGGEYRQYWCQIRPSHPSRCGKVRMDQRQLDRIVEEFVVDRLGDPRHADRVNRVAAKREEERDRILSRLHQLQETGKGIAAKAAVRGHEWVDAAMGPIDTEVAELTAELAKLNATDTPEEAAFDATLTWDKATPLQRRAMVRRAFPEGLFIGLGSSRGDDDMEGVRRIQVGKPGSDVGRDAGRDRKAS